MRILILSHYYYPESNAPATRMYELTRRWADRDHEVTVIAPAPSVPDGKVYDGYENRTQRDRVEGVNVIRVRTFLAANRGRVRRGVNYLSFMRAAVRSGSREPAPDLVLATSPQLFCGSAGAQVARRHRVPFILEIRDLWPASIPAAGATGNRLLLGWLEWVERHLYNGAAHIVTVGEGYREELIRRNVPFESISIVPSGVDLKRFSPRDPNRELQVRLGLSGCFVCAYVGTIGMASGLEVVLDAAKLLAESGHDSIRFLLVGDGAIRRSLQNRAKRGGLTNIVFTGRRGADEIPDLLSISDVCLVHLLRKPLFKSVLPAKIYEAAAMARPILLGVEGHAKTLIRTADAGMCIEPENPRRLADALIHLAAAPDEARRMGEAAQRNIALQHDYDRIADSYLQLLAQQVGENANHRGRPAR